MKLYLTLLRLYLALSGTVFLLVGFFHLFRLANQWPIIVGDMSVPFFLSYSGLPGAIGAFATAIWLIRRSSKEHTS